MIVSLLVGSARLDHQAVARWLPWSALAAVGLRFVGRGSSSSQLLEAGLVGDDLPHVDGQVGSCTAHVMLCSCNKVC